MGRYVDVGFRILPSDVILSVSVHSSRPSGGQSPGVPGTKRMSPEAAQELKARDTISLHKPWAPPLCNPQGQLLLPVHPGGPG